MADPFSAWGPEQSGTRLAEKDILFNQMEGLKQQKMLGDIAMQPAELRSKTAQAGMYEAHAKLYGAKADEAVRENERDARSEQANIDAGDLPSDPVAALYEMAQRDVRAGNPVAATTKLQRAGTLVQQMATAERNLAQGAKAEVEAKIVQTDRFSNMLGGVNNQRQLDMVNSLYEQAFGAPSPLKTYTPDGVRTFQQFTLSAKDKLKLRLDEIEESGRNYRAGLENTQRIRTNDIRERELERREEQDEVRAKAGGKATGKPSKGDLDAADLVLKDNQPDLKGDGKKLASQSIASRAMELMRANRALGRQEAIERAYNEELEDGSFQTEKRQVLGREIPGTSTTKFTGGGKSPGAALPLPAGDIPSVMKALKKGRYYVTVKGRAKWNGEGFDDPEDR